MKKNIFLFVYSKAAYEKIYSQKYSNVFNVF